VYIVYFIWNAARSVGLAGAAVEKLEVIRGMIDMCVVQNGTCAVLRAPLELPYGNLTILDLVTFFQVIDPLYEKCMRGHLSPKINVGLKKRKRKRKNCNFLIKF